MNLRRLVVGVFAAALLGLGTAARAVEYVKPGDLREITLKVSNPSDSLSAITGAAASFKVVPPELASFVVLDAPGSVLGPVSIPVGGDQTFRVKFAIGEGPANAGDASFSVVLLATSTADGVLPAVGSFDADSYIASTEVLFTTKPVPFSLDRLG